MKKKLAVLLAGVVALSSFTIGVMSKGLVEKIEAELRGDFTVYVDGKKQIFRDVNGDVVEPILYEGTTYLPIRAIGELMGKTVYWYQDDKRIELVEEKEDSLVTDADVIVNGDKKDEKPVKPEMVDKEVKVDVTLEDAKEAVLKKAGVKEKDVVFTKAKLDFDDGKYYYEIDFKTDTDEYDAEVDATTGKIVEWEVEARKGNVNNDVKKEQITKEEAKEIALKKVGLKEKDVTFVKVQLDTDDGRLHYEIKMRHGYVEYDADIDAITGDILEWEKDVD